VCGAFAFDSDVEIVNASSGSRYSMYRIPSAHYFRTLLLFLLVMNII
jgi:hypothetical protein